MRMGPLDLTHRGICESLGGRAALVRVATAEAELKDHRHKPPPAPSELGTLHAAGAKHELGGCVVVEAMRLDLTSPGVVWCGVVW
jgi:hypothetical protein